MKKLTLICFVIALVGCGAKTPDTALSPEWLHYRQDQRTKLCFAILKFSGYNTEGMSISNVPCTPEVIAALEK